MIRNIGSLIVDELRLQFVTRFFLQDRQFARLLDLGCGEKPFQYLYGDCVKESVGIDLPSSPHNRSDVDVFASGMALPFENESFDVVLCSEVMEHVPEPGLLLGEIFRVLSPGGKLILTTPFMVAEHETPIDYFRYTRYGLRFLLSKSGFTVDTLQPFGELFGVMSSVIVQLQMKFWTFLANRVHLKILATEFNPFVFMFAVLPQWAYLGIVKAARKTARGRTGFERLSYSTKGFGAVGSK